jgi:hypothetical protein
MAAKSKDAEFRFELKGRVVELDSDDLTFGEVEWIEDYLGVALSAVDFNSVKAQWALAYVAYKRKVADATFDELRDCKLNALKEAPAPKEKGSEPEKSGSQSS